MTPPPARAHVIPEDAYAPTDDPDQRFQLWARKPDGRLVHLSSCGTSMGVGLAFGVHCEDGDLDAGDVFGVWHAEAGVWVGPALTFNRPPFQ